MARGRKRLSELVSGRAGRLCRWRAHSNRPSAFDSSTIIYVSYFFIDFGTRII